MQNQAFRVADIGEMGEELDGIDDFDRRVVAALDTENNHAAEAVFKVGACQSVGRIVLKAGIADPRRLSGAF